MPNSDELCPLGFIPHSIRPTRCKRCFRGYEEHKKKSSPKATEKSESAKSGTKVQGATKSTTVPEIVTPNEEQPTVSSTPLPTSPDTTTSPAAVLRRRRPDANDDHYEEPSLSVTDTGLSPSKRSRTRPSSWSGSSDNRKRPEGGGGEEADRGNKDDDDDDMESSPSHSPRPSIGGRSRRVQIVSTRELRPSVIDDDTEIPETASADVAFILRVKTSTAAQHLFREGGSAAQHEDDQDDSVSVSASTTTETTLCYHDSLEDMQATVQTLRRQVDDLQQKCRLLEADREKIQSTSFEKEGEALGKTAGELLRLKAQVFELKTANEDSSDDNRVLRLQTKELRDEVDEIRERARSFESKCEELENENTELKREMQDMEEEIDEMQDNFQEDQAGQFHDMRKNMEQLERNCRILQFKLRKAERRCEQLETDNTVDGNRGLRTTVAATEDGSETDDAEEKMLRLEAELRASRQVAAKLHAEAEILRTRLARTDRPTSNGGLAATADDDDKTKLPHFALPAQSEGDDSGQLIRELYDTVEREKDLKEQLKFSEEEATSLRKKLTSFEEENDSLVMQIKKMVGNRPVSKVRRGTTTTAAAVDSGTASSSQLDDNESGEAESAAEVRLQLDLVEQESKVLRTKMADVEGENERLARDIKEFERKLKEATASHGRSSFPPSNKDSPAATADVVHYQQTIRILETEAKELRRKLIDKQRENEQVHAEINNYKSVALRRGSRALAPPTVSSTTAFKSMRRSASLDSEDNDTTTLDLRRQLQLLEQEAAILRQRTLDLENENDRIVNENKRLTIAGSKKQIQETSVKTTSTTKLREQEQEISRLQEKIKELTEAADQKVRRRSSDASKPQPEGGAYRQKTPKKVTENCTRPELRKYVGDLEAEIKELGRALEKQTKAADNKTGSKEMTPTAAATVHAEIQTDTDLVAEENKELQTKLAQKDVELNKAKSKTTTGPKNKALSHEIDVLKKKVETLEKTLVDETTRYADISKELEIVKQARTEVTEHEKILRKELQGARLELEAEKAKPKDVDTNRPETDAKAQLLTDLQRQHQDLRRETEAKTTSFERKVKELEAESKLAKEAATQKERELREATSQVKTETKRRERIERDYEAELRERDDDLNRLRDKVRKSEVEIERLSATAANQSELQNRIKGLERSLAAEKSEHDDLTTRHEALEEDYVIVKAQLVETEAQYGEGQLMKNLRETFNQRQDTWIREKLDMQEKIKELLCKLSRANTTAWDLERDLKNAIDEQMSATERMKQVERTLNDEVERLKCKVDETNKTLENYERIRDVTATDGQAFVTAKETQDLRNKLQQEERSHRSELSSIRFRYDQQLVAYQSEIQALHLQNAKFRRERDAYGLMMKGAQETVADLKAGSASKPVSEQMEELRLRVERLKQEKDMVADRLDSAERNSSRAKTEFTIEKSSWEIRMAELQTKINELEEANVMQGSGKSRIVGVKSRLELAWQKERDEQRRLLADAKHQLEELRKHMGSDQTHTQTKIQELQEDLLQLRDAHSKMRSFNDRVRRDKDRIERERDELRMFVGRTQQLSVNERRSVVDLVEEMLKIQMMVPSVLGENVPKTSTTSHAGRVQPDEELKQKFKSSLKRITNATEELRRVHGAKEDDRIRRNLSYRRAMSEDEDRVGGPSMTTARDDPLSRWQNPKRLTNYPASPPSMYITPQRGHPPQLYRKSLSLDQSFGTGDSPTSALWRSSEGDTSGGSSASLMSGAAPTPSPRLKKHLRRARLTAGSSLDGSDASATTSLSSSRETSAEPAGVERVSSDHPTTPSKKSGVKRTLLRRLTKSKSVEGTPTANHIKRAGIEVLCSPALGSSSSVSEAGAAVAVAATVRDTKIGKDLKSRIANLFKKSSSRSNSVDEGVDPATGANTLSSRGKGKGVNPALHKRYGSTSAL